ncbi:hypothetical protein [Mucilaginibacter sp.]|jgi:hypothetical protein|uniref:hypothetical protein n=1 Tax=Mucilaginibacter sp. TaxID=1882438 RepID=UPI0035674483
MRNNLLLIEDNQNSVRFTQAAVSIAKHCKANIVLCQRQTSMGSTKLVPAGFANDLSYKEDDMPEPWLIFPNVNWHHHPSFYQ